MSVLAHQGGWDELLLVLLPIGIFAGLLALANRRATHLLAEREGASSADEGADGGEGSDGAGEGPTGPPPTPG
jgi:hypothetical protein